MIRPAIVVRLSREDLNQPGSLEEKMQRHLALSRELVQRHGLPEVPPEDIYLESGVSGRKLSKRPETRRLLEQCQTGHYSHLVCAYQDRLLRGDKRDEADVEDALLEGQVTLITSEGVIRFDETYEGSSAFMFEIRAASARNYVRDVVRKVKEANKQRALKGQRSVGQAPYGYVWQPARYEQRRLVEPAHHEIVGELRLSDSAAAAAYAQQHVPACLPGGELDPAAYLALARRRGQPGGALLPGVECVSGEYAVVLEIFRRIWQEGYLPIVRDLNARGIPTSAAARLSTETRGLWYVSVVQRMLRRTFYAGFPAHTETTDYKGRLIRLPPEKVILSEQEQEYPHPIRLPQHQQLQETIRGRSLTGAGRPGGNVLLTGLVVCSNDAFCSASGRRFICRCAHAGMTHLGDGIAQSRANDVALYLLRQALERLPGGTSPQGQSQATGSTDAWIELNQAIQKKRRDLEDLRRHETAFARSGGSEAFASTIAAAAAEIADLQAQSSALRNDETQAQARASLALLEEIRKYPFEEVWEQANIHERRKLIRFVVRRLKIDSRTEHRRQVQTMTVEVQPWIAAFWDPKQVTILSARKSNSI